MTAQNYDSVTLRKAYPVRVGDFVMYCESFRAEGTADFSQQSTVNGDTVISSSARRALKITVKGRIIDVYQPLRIILKTDSFQSAGGKCNVEYRGLVFNQCSVENFIAEDKGDDYIYATITLLTSDTAHEKEVS
ncbi:MAG: hypothetical protein IJO99_05495 [Ruminococcus sp.]|nr:hypothetical protein [Ruminococcus sp.]MBQ9957002.1 hypothetical protein [Ruminococcus sp.]MBR6792123.1 hypothetical protein [Ruminococcus sp.]